MGTVKPNIRDQAGRVLATKSFAILELSIAAIILGTGVLAGIDTYIFLGVGWLSLWLRRVGWKGVGLAKPTKPVLVVIAGLAIGVVWSLCDIFLIEPLIEWLTGRRLDLSLFAAVKGNVTNYLIMLAIVWLLVAFGEELTYRGYLLNRAIDVFGRTPFGWFNGLFLVSACFGFAHSYQGLTGIITTAYVAFGLGLLYLVAGRNLWLPIIVHGSYDTVAITLIYMNLYPALR